MWKEAGAGLSAPRSGHGGGPTMKLTLAPCDDVMVLELAGKIPSDDSYDDLHGQIKTLIARGHRKFLLDFRGVRWISSNGIGLIIGAYHSVRRAGGTMRLCRLNQRSLSILYVCQLQLLLEIHEDRAGALAAFAEGTEAAATTS
jgi:anti-anti-sigma factor